MGEKKRYRQILETLQECDEYFAGRADADLPSGCRYPIPNTEMRLQMMVREAMENLAATREGEG